MKGLTCMESTAQLIYDISFLIRLFETSKMPNGNNMSGDEIENLSDIEGLVLRILDFKKSKMYISDFKKTYPVVSMSKFSTNITNLRKKGLLEKRIDSVDERKTVVVLTESGKKAISVLRNGEMKLYEEIARGLNLNPKKDKAIYHAALKRGIDHFGKRLKQE